MEKRNSERISASLPLRFPCCNSFYPGTISNLSGNGLFITTELSFPVGSEMELLLKLKDCIFKVPVKIVRVVDTDHKHRGMGVKILKVPEKYLEYLAKYISLQV